MKAHLLYRDRDLSLEADGPWNTEALRQDLRLDVLLGAMAAEDEVVRDAGERVLLASLHDPDAIRYRQEALRDCLALPDVVRELYAVATDAAEAPRQVFGSFLSETPEGILSRSVRTLVLLRDGMRRLRALADAHAHEFGSEAFTALFATIASELDDAYLDEVDAHLEELEFPTGVHMSAELGPGNRGRRHVLHRARRRVWRDRLSLGERSSHSFQIPERDEGGFRALSQLRSRGVDLAARAVSQAAAHVVGFFRTLRAETGFYVGCLNLHDRLTATGAPVCVPQVLAAGRPVLRGMGLTDPCLALLTGEAPVGNDLDADGAGLLVVTGANQGGKSTLLRAVGLAQLMLQSGMFVAAEEWAADVRTGVATHFTREEDAAMERGKLDEELARMSEIVEHLRPGALLLCNESFASTNEREGSEIAHGLVTALLARDVKVAYVTHLYELASRLHAERDGAALFLRAERERTFRLAEGAPLPTSYGEDLYERIFEVPPPSPPPAPTR